MKCNHEKRLIIIVCVFITIVTAYLIASSNTIYKTFTALEQNKMQAQQDEVKEIHIDNYIVKEGAILRVKAGTTVEDFKKRINLSEEEMENSVFLDENGKELEDTNNLSTGAILKLQNNNQYKIIIIGDVNKDGNISITDLALAKLHFIGKELLEDEASIKATDIDGNENLTITDLAQLKLIIIGKINIVGPDIQEKPDKPTEETAQIENQEVSNKYPKKQEEVNIIYTITTNKSENISKVVVNNQSYDANKIEDGKYQITVNVGDIAGVVNFDASKVIFEDEKEIDVASTVKVDVLKDKPTVTDFEHTDLTGATEVTVRFKINDTDNAITNGNIIIEDEEGKEVKRETLETTKNSISFNKTLSEGYVIRIIADYDLDSNTFETGKNEYTNQELLSEEIGVSLERRFEMKDITKFIVYKQSGENISEVIDIPQADLANLNNFIVKIEMKDMPSFYTSIEEYKIENGKLNFVLSNKNIIQYVNDEKQDKLTVTFGAINDSGVAEKNDITALISRIKANPSGTFDLFDDYDVSGINTEASLINLDVAFTGTINGNGHKLYNLDKPLFNNIENATIQNLILEDVNLSATTSKGSIANTATNANVKNVHIKNLNLTTKANETAGFIGNLIGGTIEECSLTNWNVNTAGHIRVAGIVGYMTGGTIKNCYVQGEVNSTQSKDGNGIGGILGHGLATPQITIENCITKVNYKWTGGGPRLNGAIIGLTLNSSAILKNNVSLSTGTVINKVYGSNINRTSTNNYELEESELISNASGEVVKTVSVNGVTKEFFKDSANFDENIWNLDGVSYDNLPILRNDDPNRDIPESKPENEDIYIPNYSRLKELENYDSNKEIAYSNVYKLMPFYESKYLVLDGNKISVDDVLNTKIIKSILPYDSDKQLITLITEENYQSIASIKVVFEDDTTKDYTLTFDEYKENVATFQIDELGIKYNFGKFVLKQDVSIVNELVEYISNLDYTEDLDPLTSEDDSRLYRDYYNENIKTNISDFVLKLLQYRSDGTITIENDILNKKVKKDLIETEKIKQMIYGYNYYKRWYSIEIGGAKVVDLMLYNSKLFADNMTIEKLLDEVLASNNRAVNVTQTFYAQSIDKYIRKGNVGAFLDYIISTIAGYEDVNDWFTENFKGIVKEIEARNHPDVEYRAWRLLKMSGGYFLPFVTLPPDCAYIVSSPTQFLVGSQRTYIVDPTNPEQKQALINKIEAYSKLISNFYTTTAGFISASRLNSFADIQVDKRYTYDSDGTVIFNERGTTEEPFHKNFVEAVGHWAALNGAQAYATGARVYWVSTSALNSFPVWSHESGHNQDSKIFLNGKGRRAGAGGEDYADGNTSQGGGDGAQNFNLAYEYGLDATTSTNLTPERIDSTEKIESYYKAMFETLDLLDYIYAKAFLTLTPEEQSKVATQVDYPNLEVEGASQSTLYSSTRWSTKTAEDFEKMNLQTVEDLWDNQVAIYPGITSSATRPGVGKYGYGTIYPTRWYQPNNPYGRPDSYTLKSLAWEMLGIGGYEGGYVTYYSRESANDLEGIQKVTKDPTMTWKKYKMGRYELMESKLEGLKYVDADEIFNQYVEALKTDAANGDRNVTASMNVKRTNYHYLKRVTNDFRSDPLDPEEIEITHIQTAEQFKQITEKPYGYYVLDNDIDVSGLTGTNAIIDGAFTGKFDGQGHKIIGNTLPLFEKLYFSYLDNLTVEGTRINIEKTQVGAIANLVLSTDISNVIVNDAEVISNQDQIGALFGNVQKAIIKNTHVTNSKVQGKNYTSGLIGYARWANIFESTTNATVIGSANSIGGFIGGLQDSNVYNSYAVGEVSGNQNVAGFVGVANSTSINNCFSCVKVVARSNSGGFIGQALGTTKLSNNISLGNCTNAYKFDGRTAADIIENYENNYEFAESTGVSTLNRTGIDFDGKIGVASISDVMNKDFYTNTLKWNNEIWDFTNIVNEGLPKLKNSDTNSIVNFMGKIQISSVEEFEKISEKLDGIYVIAQDIDFTGYTGSGNAVITSTFTGKIDGNGHTISNLNNYSLFANFRGTVENLNIRNFTNTSAGRGNGDFVTAFTQESFTATFRNMRFEDITLSGRNNVAVLSGMDGRENANSIFENISVKNANVTGSGVYVSTFIGRKYGGKLKNIYVQGQMECYSTENGGIIGSSHQNIQIENVISNVCINRPRSTDSRNNNGGFIGNVYNNPSITNSISIGNMTGFTNNNAEINVSKFAGCTEENIISYFSNCYELDSTTGTSNVTENTTGHLETVSSQNLNAQFYKDLGFDEEVWDFTKINEQKCPELK